jgi:hypothetical protein
MTGFLSCFSKESRSLLVSKDVERETRRFEVCQRNVACRTAVEGRIAIHVLGYNKQLKGYGKENTCGGSNVLARICYSLLPVRYYKGKCYSAG